MSRPTFSARDERKKTPHHNRDTQRREDTLQDKIRICYQRNFTVPVEVFSREVPSGTRVFPGIVHFPRGSQSPPHNLSKTVDLQEPPVHTLHRSPWEYYSSAGLFARFTRSLVENPVIASRYFRKRLLVSRITSSFTLMSDPVSMMTDFPPAVTGVTSSRLSAPYLIRYPFSVFSGSTPKQFFSSTAIRVSRSFVRPLLMGYSCIILFYVVGVC